MVSKIFFPGRCVLCAGPSKRIIDLCEDCEKELPIIAQACHRCGRLLSVEDIQGLCCGECLQNSPPFDVTVALFQYQKPVTRLITAFKFHNQLVYAQVLGLLMAKQLQKFYADCEKPEIIIPVPLHRRRLQERGYNQALELARPIAKRLNIPVDTKICRRIINTEPQIALPASDRKNNLRQAFSMQASRRYRSVAIIDDVMTTGSTVAELCRTIKQTGVNRVDVWCCAHA